MRLFLGIRIGVINLIKRDDLAQALGFTFLARTGLTVLSQELDLAQQTEEIATSVSKRRWPALVGVHDKAGNGRVLRALGGAHTCSQLPSDNPTK